MEKRNKVQICFYEKINKTDKPSIRVTKIKKDGIAPSINWISSTFIEHSTHQQQNTHYFQLAMKHVPILTISWAIKKSP